MRSICSLDLFHSLADHSLSDNDSWLTILSRFGLYDGLIDSFEVMAIDADDIPTQRVKVFGVVNALSEVRHLVQGDIVLIVDHNQVVETVVTGEGSSFERNSLLQATVTAESNHMMIKNLVVLSIVFGSSKFSGSSHSYCIANSSAKRASGRFDARGIVLRGRKFRMTRSHRVVLTETFELLHGKIISCQVQPRVDEHRSMTS
mmetsp:Transcript_75490/g.119198  ORF Transcript_75490/g.119198 Transcript_75490/m.119198 type:complete len:203 (+) Transcript_75490:724-1332(+)